MRRVLVLAMAVSLLGSALSGTALAAKANGGNKPNDTGQNSSPHFITGNTSLYGYTTSDNSGDLALHWMVAGLGYNGYAWIVVQGKAYVTTTCRNPSTGDFKTTSEHQVPVNEHPVFADQFGNAQGDTLLHPNALCKGNSVLVTASVHWSNLEATLWPSQAKSGTPYDHEYLSGTWDVTI